MLSLHLMLVGTVLKQLGIVTLNFYVFISKWHYFAKWDRGQLRACGNHRQGRSCVVLALVWK